MTQISNTKDRFNKIVFGNIWLSLQAVPDINPVLWIIRLS